MIGVFSIYIQYNCVYYCNTLRLSGNTQRRARVADPACLKPISNSVFLTYLHTTYVSFTIYTGQTVRCARVAGAARSDQARERHMVGAAQAAGVCVCVCLCVVCVCCLCVLFACVACVCVCMCAICYAC
jgi:hypothetical protein